MTDSYQAFGLLLAQVWGQGVQGRVMRPAGRSGSGLMFAADHHGHRHLLAPISEDEAFKERWDETLILTEWRNGATRYLDLACTSDSLAHVFASLADDVVRRVEDKDEEPARALLGALTEWKRLFKAAPALSEDQARGLFGELVVLGLLTQRNPGYALDLWTGPDADVHDFTSPNGDLEVKTSGSEGLDVSVSSLDQLDPTEDRPLVLIRLQVIASPNGQNIRDKSEELSAAGLVSSELIAKLASAGFMLGSDPDSYRFALAGEPVAWLVDETFPGLRASDLAPERIEAIRRVTYSLDLIGAGPRMSDHELSEYVDQMVRK